MSIKTVYIRAKSKAAFNREMKGRGDIFATEYNLFNPDGYETAHLFSELAVGTVVKFYQDTVGGQPYAKAYGQVAARKDGSKYVK